MRKVTQVAVLLFVAAVCTLPARAADLGLSPTPGVLLLTNGELIAGTITSAGDRYDVRLDGGEIRVKRSQVALVARNAHECYLHKRTGIESGRAQDHLDLAEWCLRNQLTDEAEKEIRAAKSADATHPKIPLLESRLRLAREKPKPVEPIAHDQKKPDSAGLDSVVHNLPAGSVEGFTNNIQPLLLNYCGRSGCHGPQSSGGMRLERIPPNRYSGRKPTQRNLRSVLATIDRTKPDQSKLLTVPIRAHGGVDPAIFTDREQSQYRQLVQWVYQVAGARQPAVQPTLEERSAPLLERGPGPTQPPAEPAPLPDADETPAAAESNPAAGATAGLSSSAAEPQSLPKSPATQPMPPSAGPFTPKDPFDPEIFNRRFSGR